MIVFAIGFRMAIFSAQSKCIISGEHIVTLGGKAVVMPVKNFTMMMEVQKSDTLSFCSKKISTNTKDDQPGIQLIYRACEFLSIPFKEVTGKFIIDNGIPVQSGLGSSAAICVNIARFLECYGYCPTGRMFDLSRYLEDYFHGKSSGLDIAVVLYGKPIIFQNYKMKEIIKPMFWPHMMLTFSGMKSTTSMCSNIITELFNKDPVLQNETTEMMNYSADLCEYAFKNSNFDQLKEAIDVANKCFQIWGLCNDTVNNHINWLFSKGAVAAKPTGSGLGGYVLSLWNKKIENSSNIGLTLEKL